MRYIFIVLVTFMFVGCSSSDTTVDNVSAEIGDTKFLQPSIKEELQPPRPPAL